jgi:hypothetical protein
MDASSTASSGKSLVGPEWRRANISFLRTRFGRLCITVTFAIFSRRNDTYSQHFTCN